MLDRLLADLIVLLHLAFVVFALLGGLLALRWPRVRWFHLPAACWAAAVELGGWLCPLTPLENRLRAQGGDATYPGDFIGRYLLALLYPAGLTREGQVLLGAVVILVNAGIYWRLWRDRLPRNPGSVRDDNRGSM